MTVDEIVNCAFQNRVKALALTDINSTMGTVDFVKACKQKGIHPVAGIEFRNSNELLYIGIAINNQGFRELNEFLTDCSLKGGKLPDIAPAFHDAYIIYPFVSHKQLRLRDNEFIGIKPSDHTRLATSEHRYHLAKTCSLISGYFCEP